MTIPALRKFALFALLALLLAAGAALSGCATMMPKATDDKRSAIAISIEAEIWTNPSTIRAFTPEKVVFARIDEGGDFSDSRELFFSNYRYQHQWEAFANGGGAVDSFILNVPPGTFAAVAAYGEGQFILFPDAVVQNSVVTVKPGRMMYAGKYVFDRIKFWNNDSEYDDVQKHYYGVIATAGWLNRQSQAYAASLKELSGDEAEFLQEHKKTFANTEWAARIANRLEDLN